MKLKTSVIAAAVLSLTNITVAQAAQELSPEQAAELKPFERITVIGRFNAIYEAADAVSRRADKIGADSFYIQGLDDISDSGNMSVTADLYRKDAPKATEEEYRVFHGVKNYQNLKLFCYSLLIPLLFMVTIQQHLILITKSGKKQQKRCSIILYCP